MKAIIEVSAKGSVFQAAAKQVISARKGRAPDFRLSFESARSLFAELTPARLDLLDTLRRVGPCSVYALAKAAERNYSNVHTDVARLEELGARGRFSFHARASDFLDERSDESLASPEVQLLRRVADRLARSIQDSKTFERIRARDRLVAGGIVINGLPTLSLEPFLDSYYFDHVIGGPGSFMVPAESYETFASAVLRKLILEIAQADGLRPRPEYPPRQAN